MIVVGLIARQLATVPDALRAGVLVEALREVKGSSAVTVEALAVEKMIG